MQVYCRASCSLNGRKPQLVIDPAVDLVKQTRSLWPAKWILPLTAPPMTKAARQDWIQRAAPTWQKSTQPETLNRQVRNP